MTAEIIPIHDYKIPEFPEIWDSTIRAAFANCQRYGYWQFIQHIRKPGGNIHLLFGGCFAKAMEIARKSYYIKSLSPRAAEIEAIISATSMWEEGNGDDLVPHKGGAANKTYAGLIDAIHSYFIHWPLDQDDIHPLQLPNGELFIEKTFAFPVEGTSHPTTGKPIIYAGRLDMLGQWKDTNLNIVVDEKTSTQLGEAWANSWPMRGQLSGYCLTDDHELLTQTGWKNITLVTTDDKIAQWDNGKVSFVNPIETFSPTFEGDLIRINGNAISICATLDHRQPVFNKWNNTIKTMSIQEIVYSNNGSYRFITAGQLTSGTWSTRTDFVRLLVAAQADGNFRYETQLRFAFKKQRKIDRMINILESLSIKYKTYNYKNGYIEFNMSLAENDIVAEIYDLIGYNKLFGDWLLNMNNDALNTFIDELKYWDGSDRGIRGSLYFTAEKNNADWVQTIAALTGHYSSVHTQQIKSHWKIAYRVVIATDELKTAIQQSFDKVSFSGKVYCIKVPSSFFLTRRNNKIVVTGNCKGSEVYGFRIRNAHIRGIGILKNDITFAEDIQTRKDWEIDNWLIQVRKDINRAIRTYQRMCLEPDIGLHTHWDQNFDSVCSSYGGCQFMGLCKSDQPERWLHNFDEIVWNPLASRD